MKLRCRELVLLFPIFASLWTMTESRPRRHHRSVCYHEERNAQKSYQYLSNSLKRLKQLFQDENIPGNVEDVCFPEESNSVQWNMELDTIAHRLCQYKICFQRVEKALDRTNSFHKIMTELKHANSYLDNLFTVFRKMKRPFHLPGCGAAQAPTEPLWNEVSNGPLLAQNLLGDLLRFTITLC